MKKFVSMALAATLCLTSTFANAIETNSLQTALEHVKSVVDIPTELSEFSTELNSKTGYYFSWTDKDNNEALNIHTTLDGHIDRYDYYRDYTESDNNPIYNYTRQELINIADDFLSSIVPELFENESDRLVADEENKTQTITPWMHISYHREFRNVRVLDNGANVTICQNDDQIYIGYANINWDYSAELNYPTELLTEPEEHFYTLSPIALEYVDKYNIDNNKFEQRLVYSFTDAKYMNAETGDACEPFLDIKYASSSDMKEEASADSANGLTPAEMKEIKAINGLTSPNTIIANTNKMGVFENIPKDAKLNYSTYQDEAKNYYYSLNISTDNGGWWITANAKTGKLISLNSYKSDSPKPAKYNEANIHSMIEDFLSKNYPAEFASKTEPKIIAQEDGYSYSAFRLVNNIPYKNQSIYVYYDPCTKKITSFNANFDDVDKAFPSPDGIIPADSMLDAIKTVHPLKLGYIRTEENKYTLCYGVDDINSIYKDAFTGEDLYEAYKNDFEYTDISGHWAEDMILKLAEIGHGLKGNEFRPDDYISASDFEALLINNMHGRIYNEKESDDSLLIREDAFLKLCEDMGYGKISKINSIFKTDFADSIDISPERVGALAILQGLGIITGDILGVRPHDYLTRAEAATLVYRYIFNN